MEKNAYPALARHYIQHSKFSSLSGIIFALASPFLSNLSDPYPLLTIVATACLVFSCLWIFFSSFKIEKALMDSDNSENKRKIISWIKNFYIIRFILTLGLCYVVSKDMKVNGLLSYSGLLASAFWVGAFENLVTILYPNFRILCIHAVFYFTAAFIPLVLLFDGSLFIPIIGLMAFHTLNLVLKARTLGKFFFEKIEIEEKHMYEKNNFEKLLDAIPATVSWFNAKGEYRFINEVLAARLNISKHEMIGKELGYQGKASVINELDRMRDFIMQNAWESEQFEVDISVNGTSRRHQIWLKKVQTAQGYETIVLGIDVEEKRLAENNLQLEREKSIQSARLAALGEMGAGIAHEIKNPLTIVLGNVSVLRAEVIKPQLDSVKITQRLDKVEETCYRIVKIVDGLKNLSRDSTNQDMSWNQAQDLVSDPLQLVSARLKSHGVDFYANQSPDISVFCQPLQIAQVILNLIHNADDAISEQEDKKIRLEYELKENSFDIHVVDNGPGVKNIEKLFTPFFTTKDPGKGTGLGLSISKKILEKNQGKLIYERRGNETYFTLRFTNISVEKKQTPAA